MESSPAAMNRIHGHYRALARGRAPAAGRALAMWRLKPLLRALRTLRRRWPRRARALAQLLQVPWFAAAYRVDPESYYRHRLDLNWARRNDYIFHDEIVDVLEDLNTRLSPQDSDDLADKRRFWRRCTDAGLPTIEVLADFEGGRVREFAPRAAFAQDLFSKYAARWCGEGATAWRHEGGERGAEPDSQGGGEGSGRYRGEGRVLALDELLAHLGAAARTQPIVLQPRIANARELRPISGRGVSTARIITVRRGDAEPEVALASYRMPCGEQVADNFAAGGIATAIDLASGRLGPGVRKARPDAAPLRDHPDSGAPIQGAVLPHWAAATALAVAAHRVFSRMASVGWDVAITDDGPVLVEGNGVWCVDLAQVSHGRPLADSIIPQAIAGHLAALGHEDR